MQDLYNETWCVICDKKIQLERLMEKGFSPGEAKGRINAQLPQKEKSKLADYVIDNSGNIEDTKKQVLKRLKELARLNHNLHLFADK